MNCILSYALLGGQWEAENRGGLYGGCVIYKLQLIWCIRCICIPAVTCKAHAVIKKSEHQRCPSFWPHCKKHEVRAYTAVEKSP
ncbi:hypothetical protein EVAR_52812_1 [Eumeta japonica]|uniref:Uncharacterized protein n=1 Tax=Eumeta variegata TaxID=151549 RepID=A0A4C1Y2N3_EUMVA|nr:hypothetical protein EVAR_52812_1 [Eumeta japonica]